jgi:N-acyl-D-aspartate/D-glutamate deacylase
MAVTNDLLIKGGTVIDGTGRAGVRADVRVRDGLVVEVGVDLEGDGEKGLDATGAFVTPGFIDSHTHFDPTIFWDPACDPVPQHGVTTVLVGNCSLSMAPVRRGGVAELGGLFGYIEDLPEHVFTETVPWEWERYPSYLDHMSEKSFGVNVAGLVGHNPIRLYVMGEEAWERQATPAELDTMVSLLRESLRAGAFGMSTSLGFDEDRRKRPVPSRVADDTELGALIEVLAEEDRFLQFIASPVPKYLTRDVARVADLTRPLGVVSTWISIFYDDQRPQQALDQLDFAGRLQASGARCYPQISPRGLDIQVNWNGGMSFYTMPGGWHRAVQAGPEEKATLLSDPVWRAVAREEWDRVPFTMIRHKLPDRILLVSVTKAENQEWVGRSFADLVAARGGHPSDVLADWLLENDLQPGVVGTGVVNSDPDGVAATLKHPACIISNSDAGAHLQMMCAVGDTTLLLARHVRDRGDLTLENAVHQLTGRPAELFGFHGRGRVEVGRVADLVVFALDDLHWDEPVMTSDLPRGASRLRRAPGGYRYTIVDGTVTQEHGDLTGDLPGRTLRRAAAA